MNYSLSKKKIWVAGHNGMVGSAVVKRLLNEDCEIITVKKNIVDLRDGESVQVFLLRVFPQKYVSLKDSAFYQD